MSKYRSAISGRYVTAAHARRSSRTTVRESGSSGGSSGPHYHPIRAPATGPSHQTRKSRIELVAKLTKALLDAIEPRFTPRELRYLCGLIPTYPL